MLNFVINLAISVWITSSLFMLVFYIKVVMSFAAKGKHFKMPFGMFIYVTFCPIVHTVKCFKVLRRYRQLKQERGV